MAGIGWSGVNLFFVLSGFLITGILYDSKGGQAYFRTFYARRLLRIFPLYYLMVFFCIVVGPLLFRNGVTAPVEDSWLWWVYLSNLHYAFHRGVSEGWLNVFWSLAVEEHFYLVWPAVIFLCRRATAIRIALGCILLASLARAWFVLHGNLNAPYVLTPCRMDDLAFGSLVALIVRRPVGFGNLGWIATRAAFVAAPIAIGLSAWKHAVVWTPVTELLTLPVFSVLFASLLVLAAEPNSARRWKSVLETGLLRTFGKYSYGIYVFHTAVAAVTIRFAFFPVRFTRANDLVNTAVLIAVSLLVAVLSWNLYEKHFLRLKAFFAYRPAYPERVDTVTPAEEPRPALA